MKSVVTVPDGATVPLDRLLGSGGQGDVWRGVMAGVPVAVKLYHPEAATPAQRACIERLVEEGPPSEHFLWPKVLVEVPGGARFGYVMDLREPRFRSVDDFMARRVVPTLGVLAAAAFQMADAFFRLHVKGLCYRDISSANVFFDPETGDVRVCDNDNVDVSGAAPGGVLGTPRFMAPEVVRGEVPPSDDTDRFSLAVLLFHLLLGGHPLNGAREEAIRCLDMPALQKLYGAEPVYVFDPADASNRPVRGVHDNPLVFRPLWPSEVLALFERSFTEGLWRPARRVRESEWRKAFLRCLDLRIRCVGCGAEQFLDPDAGGARRAQSCWRCRRPVAPPVRLVMDEHVVILQPGQVLRPHHLKQPVVLEDVVAEVVAHPKDPRRWGLRNCSKDTWTLVRPDGSMAPVLPGQSVPVLQGNRVDFGTVAGTVEWSAATGS